MSDLKPARRGRGLMVAVALAAVAAAAGLVAMRLAPRNTDFNMESIVSDVYQRFPEVEQLAGDEVATRIASAKPPLLIDVRDDAEYQVSHIAGAERADPSAKPDAIAEKFGSAAAGRDVIFYCSVGMRSSELASASQEKLIKAGATGVFNLVGGLFGWHNAKRPLVGGPQPAGTGATEFVHPFNAKWGKLVERQELIRTDAAR